MTYAEYPLFAEGYINRFLTTGVYTKEQKFTKAVLSGRVNEWLKKGFSIHENPCRKEFIVKRQDEIPPFTDLSECKIGERISVFQQENALQMYFPFGNIGMEKSGFYYVPTFLRSYSYAILSAEHAGEEEFELTTCGGLTLWVNGQLVLDFTPFTRNEAKSTRVLVSLKEGENTFLVCLDDLAERDTDYYFQIRRTGESRLSILLPVEEGISLDSLNKMEGMLEQICFEQEAYISEPVNLQMHNNLGGFMPLQVTITPGEFIEKMERQEELVETRSYLLESNQKMVKLLHSDEIRPGFYYFSVRLQLGTIELERKIGTQLVRKEFLEYREESLEERKKRSMDTILQFGVDNVYKAAVFFKLGVDEKRAESIISEELEGVRKRRDCSDFHFIMIIYIYKTFPEKLSAGLELAIEEAMLHYRYWIDEPGDDVMWFFSENHALLFHICQYLAGESLPDRIFTNSGNTGEQLKNKAYILLKEWFDSFFKEFVTEWNSNAYIPIDVLGLGTLYNLMPKGSELHGWAKRALDMIFLCLSLNEHKGAVMTSFGRSYEKELKGNYNAGTTSLLYVAYNAGFLNRAAIGYISLVLGAYEAPSEYRRYLQLSGEKELVHQNTQGYEKHVNLYLYKNADVLLSTAVGFKPYWRGYQEHIVQAVIDETAQVFLNHPGESHPYGSGRPNFWAGNGMLPMAMQYRNVCVVKYDIEADHRIDFTHAYIPLAEFQQYRGDINAIVLKKDGGYIGVKAMNGLEIQVAGPCRHREFISRGRQNVWVIKVAQNGDYENLEAFLQAFRRMEISLNEEKEVTVRDGDKMVYSIDKENGCYVNGEKIYDYPLSVEGRLEFKGD